jgi:ATP-binding cassette, subfamily B (MDR/TAP), member 1
MLVKDGDDSRNLIGVVLGQFFVVASVLGVGLVYQLPDAGVPATSSA